MHNIMGIVLGKLQLKQKHKTVNNNLFLIDLFVQTAQKSTQNTQCSSHTYVSIGHI